MSDDTKKAEPVQAYIRDWIRIIYDATGDQTKVNRAIELADLNGLFDPVKFALAAPPRCDAQSEALRQNIESKLTQLKHYRDHECQLDHARTIAEGRILQLGQVKHWIAALSETKPAQGDAE